MKKYIIFCLLITLIVTFLPTMAYADNEHFQVISTTNSDYTYKINTINSSSIEYSEYGFSGRLLKDYIIANIPSNKYSLNAGTVEWENPNYMIINGEQKVNVIYKDALTNKIDTFTVLIDGMPLLNAKTINMQPSTIYDLNIIGKVPNSIYKWYSDNEDVVTVEEYGYITAMKKGATNVHCIITYPDKSTKLLTCKVNVSNNINTNFSLTKSKLKLSLNNTYNVDINNKVFGSKYAWYSSDYSVVGINGFNGIVTAKKNGKAIVSCTITLKNRNAYALKCNVVVK